MARRRSPPNPHRGLSVVSELAAGPKTYFTIADSRKAKRYSVVAKAGRVACSDCRSVECRHAKYVAYRTSGAMALIAEFDAMAAERRAEAKRRAAEGAESTSVDTTRLTGRNSAHRVRGSGNPQCAETVGTGTQVRQCSFLARSGSAYCGRHQTRPSSSDDFEDAPLITDAPDSFAF